ncbi:hypothetical protein NLU03_31265 [Bacillus toyonensis]|nr:hypothetical protein [Bacillus toyonensis]
MTIAVVRLIRSNSFSIPNGRIFLKIPSSITGAINIESWQSLKEEMQMLDITDNDIFHIQMIELKPNQK